MEQATEIEGGYSQDVETLTFGSTEVLLDYYGEGYKRAQVQRSENDHKGALITLRHLQKVIGVSKSNGVDCFEIRLKEANLHFAVTEGLTILQESPDEIMIEYHRFGEILQEFIERVASLDARFDPAIAVLSEGFTATDIDSLEVFLEEILKIKKEMSVEDVPPGQLSILAMFYFFMTKYIEAIQDFFIFTTKHTENAKRCVPLFKEMAQAAMEYLERVEEDNLSGYKNHAVMWFGFYDKVIEAKLALYMHQEIGDVLLAFSTSDAERLKEIIDENLKAVNEIRAQIADLELEDKTDFIKRKIKSLQATENAAEYAAEHAMEILIDMYAVDALTNLQNYEQAVSAIYEIIAESDELENSQRVQFKAHLNLAKVAKKHLLDFGFNYEDIDAQLIPHAMQEAVSVRNERAKSRKTRPYGEVSLPDFDDLKTQIIDRQLGGSETVLVNPYFESLPDEDVNERQYQAYVDGWKLRITEDFKVSFDEAVRLAPESDANHIAHKELSLLQVRLSLTEGLQVTADEDVSQAAMSVLDAEKMGMYKGSKKLRLAAKLVNIAIPTAANNGLQYYRHVAEAHVLRGRLGLKWIQLYRNFNPESSNIDSFFRRAYEDLCVAFNILKELGDTNVALGNEIKYVYEELANLEPEATEEVQGTRFAVTNKMQAVAQNFQQQSWRADFDATVSDVDSTEYRGAFEDMLRKRISCISSIAFVQYSSEYDEYFKDGIYEQNRYGVGEGAEKIRTVIRFSEKSNGALEVTSKVQLTSNEQRMIQQILPRLERHLYERSR